MTRTNLGEDNRILFRENVEKLIARTKTFMTPGSVCSGVVVQGWWQSEMQWARNYLNVSADRRDLSVRFGVELGRASGSATTNQIDDASLKGVVAQAERNAYFKQSKAKETMEMLPPILPMADATVWSDSTFNAPTEQRAKLIAHLTTASRDQSLMSAGYIELRGGEFAVWDAEGADPKSVEYYTYSQAQCSMTVRHPKGQGSGWAGLSSYDWARIDAGELADRALKKCVASLNPVAIEPGRYTTILEPQAVSQLCENLIGALNNRIQADRSANSPFSLNYDQGLRIWRNMLGMKVVDDRITIEHDPEDPELGVIPRPGIGRIRFIENGVLTQMALQERRFGVEDRNINDPEKTRSAYRMSGGSTTTDEMIATTKRGLLVTRFGHAGQLDGKSLLCTGFTRDGLWLIENGKLSKAVKNMRFTESPLFMLNNLEQMGPAVPVFRPVRRATTVDMSPAIVPTLKVNDFSFTAMVDAV